MDVDVVEGENSTALKNAIPRDFRDYYSSKFSAVSNAISVYTSWATGSIFSNHVRNQNQWAG